MSPRRKVPAARLAAEPWQGWNAFVDLLAMSSQEDLEPRQRPAHYVFWYESEVQNGGHFQYFQNRGVAQVPETIASLRELGAAAHAEVLAKAHHSFVMRQGQRVGNVEQYLIEEAAVNLEDYDRAFHASLPSLLELLERHFEAHRDWYIDVGAA